jgi:lysozyme
MREQEVIDMLVRHEGIRTYPYHCSQNRLTIGIGRNIQENGISEDEAYFLLKNDIERVKKELDKSLQMWRCFPKKAQLVCIDMCFQMGITKFLGFRKTIALMQMDMFLEASEELLNSRYATQTPQRAAYNSRQLALCHGKKVKRDTSK